jgi:hypothetical protein
MWLCRGAVGGTVAGGVHVRQGARRGEGRQVGGRNCVHEGRSVRACRGDEGGGA